MAPRKKFDYDSPDFYNRVYALALQGLTDAEIAVNLSDKEGGSLRREVFSSMKNGTYDKWTPEENARRSRLLANCLAGARDRINGIVRGAYLKAALGGKKVKSRSVVTRRLRIEGALTDDEEIQTTETESELPPNMQALATWLYQHDPQWRKVQRGLDTDDADIPADIAHGIDIDAWIRRETDSEPQQP
ncbi:MAG: hypothetical protein NC117_10970 [Pseudoflavonifractor sp.]|nr:hypothetical protein [Pseudoflavonifractor sp.]